MNINLYPSDWYWLADDGRVFSSARAAIVQKSDAAFIAWSSNGSPTRWPADSAGHQTIHSLQDVLTPYNIFTDLSAYAAAARYNKEVAGITVGGKPVATDRGSQAQIANAWALLQASGATSIQFKNADGTFSTMTSDQFKALALSVGAHVQGCFGAEAQVNAGLSASPPTVAAKADVDAIFAAVTV